ncbi:MAG TPA: GNAT family N-acetyltransferase, partial [Propionibacteriaceae bacterium]|nr:GNAT family N-acetyltransferase [Propionibacteriaceae bacterium]
MPTPPSVRLALPGEAAAITYVQRAAWASDEVESRFLDEIGEADMRDAWEQAILRPPLAHYRVLVAIDESTLVGFAAVGPSADPDADARDAEVAEFVIHPDARGIGHTSRLEHAVVDTLRADGYKVARWWLRSTDDALRAFLAESGWVPDGATREVGNEEGTLRLKQVRVHTSL